MRPRGGVVDRYVRRHQSSASVRALGMGVYGITGLVLFVSAIYGSNLVMRTIAQPQTVSVLENDTSPPAEPVEVNVPAVQHDPTQGAVEHCSEVDCNSNEMQPVWVEALKRCVCIRTRDK